MQAPTVLVILDGLGYRKETAYNAVAQAHTPTLDELLAHYPHTLLQASGCAVGLLPGVVGNSEVGHLTIGAGRVVPQPIALMDELINSGGLCKHAVLANNFAHLALSDHTLHIMGLLSDSGVHAHERHLYALVDCARDYGIKHIAIHCFLDGRDSPPQSAAVYLERLEQRLAHVPGAYIATLCGRFYAMDRNKEWSRTHETYAMLTQQQKIPFATWRQVLAHYYTQNITDEFIPPTQLTHDGVMHDGDGVIFFNYRPDRARQLMKAFVEAGFNQFKRVPVTLAFFITPTVYDKAVPTLALLPTNHVTNTLMNVLCAHNISTFTIAETEKYAHVTYFFNAGREGLYSNETRVVIPSISAQTYKDVPCMRAPEITQRVLASLQGSCKDFYLINYANPDMVGHAGDVQATIKAVECVDKQLAQLYAMVVGQLHGTLYITADHGNAELQWDEVAQQPHTAHTTNPVEFIMVSQAMRDKKYTLPLQGLKDIAPFILRNRGIAVPHEMR